MSNNLPSFIVGEHPCIQRLYNGRKLVVYDCRVRVNMIQGWIDNPRIDLAKKQMQEQIGDRELTQDEIFDIMKSDKEIRLKELRDDILKNGLREPLTLSFTGRLLDGNRRFFAIRYVLEGMAAMDTNRQDFEVVPAYVLADGITKEDEKNVLVEENFSSSLKIEWPESVKAKMVLDDYERDIPIEEIAKRYCWTKAKVNETVRIKAVIDDFISFATTPKDLEDENGGGLGMTELQAESICAENYQFFNEAQKSFDSPLKTDAYFKMQFFRWIAEGKFMSFQEVRIAYKAWQSPEARAAILQPEPAAAKAAKAILDYNERVVKSTGETVGRINNFVQFLNSLTVSQLQAIPEATRDALQSALRAVIKMSSTEES